MWEKLFRKADVLWQNRYAMIFKKGDFVTSPSGAGIVYADQQADEVQVLITATNNVETFNEEDVEYDNSEGNSPEGLDA